ncbi:MAG: hypothetical protein AAF221_03215 [Pseudomonadota bacterium]
MSKRITGIAGLLAVLPTQAFAGEPITKDQADIIISAASATLITACIGLVLFYRSKSRSSDDL